MSERVRVLIIVHGYPPAHGSGSERRAERTARGLAGLGHDVTVLCREDGGAHRGGCTSDDRYQDGVRVRRLYLPASRRGEAFAHSYDHPGTAQAVTDLIDQWQPAVVHLFSGYLMSASVVSAAAARHVPVVVSLTDYWWLCHRINLIRSDGSRCDGPSPSGCARCQAETQRRFRQPAQLWPDGSRLLFAAGERWPALGAALGVPEQIERARALRAALAQVAAFIAPSRYVAGMHWQHGIGVGRIHVWRQGVELDACPLRQPAAELRVGYLGQIKYHKGVDLLLAAWRDLVGSRPRRLVLYGSDAGERRYGDRIRSLLDELDDVSWPGACSSQQIWEVLAHLDVVVVPSRWVENSPNSLLEAQAMGIPIVGTRLGGIAELVQHERNGLLFAPNDAVDLARQLQRFLDEPDLLPRLRCSPLAFRSVRDEVDQIVGLYQHLTSDTALLGHGAAASD